MTSGSKPLKKKKKISFTSLASYTRVTHNWYKEREQKKKKKNRDILTSQRKWSGHKSLHLETDPCGENIRPRTPTSLCAEKSWTKDCCLWSCAYLPIRPWHRACEDHHHLCTTGVRSRTVSSCRIWLVRERRGHFLDSQPQPERTERTVWRQNGADHKQHSAKISHRREGL